MVMVQASFFVGPMLGGVALATAGYGALFAGCAAVSLAGVGLMLGLPKSANQRANQGGNKGVDIA
jgi:predicted MFS family arabinose efflux permease